MADPSVKLDGTPRKGPGGRRPKLTPELIERISECIRLGIMTQKQIAGEIRVPVKTYKAWLTRARNPKVRGMYRKLGDALRAAEAEAEAALLKIMDDQIKNPYVVRTEKTVTKLHDTYGNPVEKTVDEKISPPAIATVKWMLARRWPERWGERARLDVKTENPDSGGLPTIVVEIPPEHEVARQAIARSMGDGDPDEDSDRP